MAKKETSNNKNKKNTDQENETTKTTKKNSSATKNKGTSNTKKTTSKSAASKNTKSKQVKENEKTKELKPVVAEAKKSVKEDKPKEKPMKKNKSESESEKVQKQLRSRVSSNDEMSRLFKIVLIVTLIFAVFYGVTLIVTKQADATINNNKSEEQNQKAEIQYDNIVIGTMLNHSGTYYVLIEQMDDTRSAEYTSLIDTIKSADDAPTIYKANLTDSFNKIYLAKEENYYVDNIADFRVTGTTLVKIENNKINSVFDNYDAIKNKLKDLA